MVPSRVMQTPNSESNLAKQACTSCKVRKRKCNKAVPRCSHCVKKRLNCSYSKADQRRNLDSNRHAGHDPILNAHNVHVEAIDHSTMLFLDPSLLQHGNYGTTPVITTIPSHILDLVGHVGEVRATVDTYFARIHPWMPFIAKKRVYDTYLHVTLSSHPDLVFLFLAQKLITTFASTDSPTMRTPLYFATKHFHLELETSSMLSIPLLQWNLLIALYEIGHAIYPAAYLTIGACARYAYALGINVKGVSTRRATTMVEVEERRRICWAIVVLDRFVSIGCPGRPFATPEPDLDEILPADDTAWDQGVVSLDSSATLSSPLTSHMSKFALLFQAARLLGQVLLYVSNEPALEDGIGVQLDRTLHSILAAALNVDKPDYDQITFIFSALVALYVPTFHLAGTLIPSTDVAHHRFARAMAVCKLVKERVHLPNLSESSCPLTNRPPQDMSPWGCFFAYQVCALHLRAKERGSDEDKVIRFFRESFGILNEGWRVAGVYLRLLEAQEAISCS